MKIPARTKKALKNYSMGIDSHDEDISILIESELYIPPKTMSHDECLRWLDHSLKSTSKKLVTDHFLYGVQNFKPEYRAAFSAFSVASKLPRHTYQGLDVYCKTCGAFETQTIDLTLINCSRYLYGSLRSMTPADLALYLQLDTNLPAPKKFTNERFIVLLSELAISPINETPTSLLKRLSNNKHLNFPKEEIRGLLETLGFTGILQSPLHPGYIYEYTPPFSKSAKTSKSDWRYPIDFWTGTNGINDSAIKFWFSEQQDIMDKI
ncbi:hypothetical protein [Pseudomonas putida]|uniref:Uncharacterized protein n=1 Tax=Pseudomonas putida TaxID=303 RepID=A0AAW4C208_PSEPU|nr:hypothetical protein [Pseudomonas putida]MBF8703741.1 hypothetical protein [Pseudomonas putida]MBF8709183.1 hypothetical protein [Pseudomonas putida]MBF8738389.1 hypothetical protein [Pseudomonas putida]